MSLAKVPVLTLTGLATGSISAGTFVGYDDQPVGAAAHTKGVAASDASSGDAYPQDVLGTTLALSGAAFSKGDMLMTDSSGRAVTQTSTNPVVARALAAATAANQLVEVLLIPN